MIKIFGDLHLRNDKKPFDKASAALVEYIINECKNMTEDDTVIFLGDMTDKSMIAGEVNALLVELAIYINKANIVIIHGNHTYSWNPELKQNSSSISLLSKFHNISIITEAKTKLLDGQYKCLFLPHLKRNMINNKSMKEYYENLPEEIASDSYDYILGHLADETNTLFGNYCDISYLKGKRILGHVHTKTGNSLGSMFSCTYAERNKDSYYAKIDENGYSEILVPKFIDYYSIKYGEELPEVDAEFPIFTITESPTNSLEDIEKLYPNVAIRQVITKELNTLINIEDEDIDFDSDDILFNRYINESDLDKDYLNYIKEKWEKRA